MTVEYKFPEGFWWGTATSGPQSEGAADIDGRKMSIWDYWYKEEPERFFDNVGPQDTSTFYANYKEDIKLLKETGHNSFRTSIQWSRLIPDGVGEVNQKAVDFYNNVIDELIVNDVLPIMNLFHFDMPMCMQEKGGWESREVVDAYAAFAKKCFELFGDRVKHWMTFNEPIVPVEGGYLYNFHYPKVKDGKRAAQVAFHTMLANAKSIKEYKEYIKKINNILKNNKLAKIRTTWLENEQQTEYICMDIYGNYFIFKGNITQYSVLLDTYTIEIDEFKEEYQKADEAKKVALNLEKFQQMINGKDYESAYYILDENFRNDKFGTLENFIYYIEENWFECNKFSYDECEENIYNKSFCSQCNSRR